jgi:hypothetical protein
LYVLYVHYILMQCRDDIQRKQGGVKWENANSAKARGKARSLDQGKVKRGRNR